MTIVPFVATRWIRFEVNLQCGGASPEMSDIALHLSVRFDQGAVVRNTRLGGWQHEEREGGLPHHLHKGGPFQLLLMCEPHGFKVELE